MVRIACVGGFLGAGKTTALIEVARKMEARGLRVGVITNDQGAHLVDTALVRGEGLQVHEITGGCFCCRFTEFVKHAARMVEQFKPDVILAEAVGSCTDLAATVYDPLQRFYGSQYVLAPLSVFVEPERVRELLGPSAGFQPSVRYLFEKQIAEAELVVLSKSDLLKPEEIRPVIDGIRKIAGSGVPIKPISARTGEGINEWTEHLLANPSPGEGNLDLDYEIYGQAEASLGWLNATVDLTSSAEFLPARLGESVVQKIQERCVVGGNPIAHLKVLLVTPDGSDRISVTSSSNPPAWDGAGDLRSSREVSAVINARVGIHPDELQRIVEDSLRSASEEHGVSFTLLDLESFAPAPPKRPELQPANG